MLPEDPELTFEQAYTRLEELIVRLDEGGLSLEEALTCYEEASALAARCNTILDSAELRLRSVEESLPADGPAGDDLLPEEDRLPF